MSSTVQMPFQDALGYVKRSLELGKVQNAIELLDSLIAQLNAREKAQGESHALKAKMLTSMDLIICGLESAPIPKLGDVNWPVLLDDAKKVKQYIEEKG